jgi:hypothetical protein
MITRTSKKALTLQLRTMRKAAQTALRKGHFARYRYARNWLKAHAALLKEAGQ